MNNENDFEFWNLQSPRTLSLLKSVLGIWASFLRNWTFSGTKWNQYYLRFLKNIYFEKTRHNAIGYYRPNVILMKHHKLKACFLRFSHFYSSNKLNFIFNGHVTFFADAPPRNAPTIGVCLLEIVVTIHQLLYDKIYHNFFVLIFNIITMQLSEIAPKLFRFFIHLNVKKTKLSLILKVYWSGKF